MRDENDREYISTAQVPRWMVSSLSKIIPLAFLSALAAGFVLWRDVAVMGNRIGQCELIANGDRLVSRREVDALVERLREVERAQANTAGLAADVRDLKRQQWRRDRERAAGDVNE